MKNNIKSKVLKSFTGLVALGMISGCFGCEPETEEQKLYRNTVVSQYGNEYSLSNLYLLIGEDDSKLCYKDVIDSKTETELEWGFSMGNNLMIGHDGGLGYQFGGSSDTGGLAYGLVTSTETTYGYVTVEDNTVIAIEGAEDQFGYKVARAKYFVSYEEALANNFNIPAEEFNELLTNDKEAILEIKSK
jgi:hypothetical protein